LHPDLKTYNALIFARHNSSRLPGKVLFTLGGETIIGLSIRKLKMINNVNVIVATSEAKTDDLVAAWCEENDVEVFRGDLDNVARRTEACLKAFPCEAFFRINADSPFMQADLLQEAINRYEGRDHVDLVSNVAERTYPYGIAVELINTSTFVKHVPEFRGDENEHITSYFYRRKNEFAIEVIKNDEDLSGYRFVLDTPEDWVEIQELYKNNNQIFNNTLTELIKINKNRT
jgi:spore coat polysaccharide biosynthesis protein SpsF